MDPNYLGDGNDDEDIYKENILDHFRNPRNFGELVEAEIKHSELNSVCGDMVNIFASVDKNNIVKEIKFKGNGCAISMAASS
ncbi:MAG: hypothetical protein CMH62_00240, partial [Nanoarchaeota archaeon]|nr:hypothetical protein [Nanoarchaeota archaeon]